MSYFFKNPFIVSRALCLIAMSIISFVFTTTQTFAGVKLEGPSLEYGRGVLPTEFDIEYINGKLDVRGHYFNLPLIAKAKIKNRNKRIRITKVFYKIHDYKNSTFYANLGGYKREYESKKALFPRKAFQSVLDHAILKCKENIRRNPHEESNVFFRVVAVVTVKGVNLDIPNLSSATKQKSLRVSLSFNCPKSNKSDILKNKFEISNYSLEADHTHKSCPKRYTVRARFIKRNLSATKSPKAKFRLIIDDNPGPWIIGTLFPVDIAKHVFDFKETIYLSPGQHRVSLVVKNGIKTRIMPKYVTIKCPPFNVNRVELKYKSPNTGLCKRKVWETARFFTNGPGELTYEIKHHGGLIAHTQKIKAKRHGNEYIAVGQRVLTLGKFNANMMARVKTFNGDSINSGWIQLKVDCLDVEKASLEFKDPKATTCPRHTNIIGHVETSIAGPVDYQLKCSNGKKDWSFKGRTQTKKNGDVYHAYFAHPLKVKRKTGHVNCVLNRKTNKGYKRIALKGHKFACSPKQKLQGGFDLLDNSKKAALKKCPRNGKALVWFNTGKPDGIHYSLDCGELGNFSGILGPKKMADGNYKAAKTITFEIKKTIQAGCTLRTVLPGQPKNHMFKPRTFACHKTAGHSVSDDLVTPRNPRTGDDPPPVGGNGGNFVSTDVKCHGGHVRKGKCHCPKNTRRGKIGKNNFRCIRVIVDCFKGYKLVKGKCVKKGVRVNPKGVRRNPSCPNGKVLVQGKCRKKLPISIYCKKGYKQVGQKCVKQPVRRSPPGVRRNPCPKNKKFVKGKCVNKSVRRNPSARKNPAVRKNPKGVRRNKCPQGKIFIRGKCHHRPAQ